MASALERRDLTGQAIPPPIADVALDKDPVLASLTLLASRLFEVPVSLITYTTDHSLQVAAATGWQGATCFPRGNSYCEQVLTSGQPLVINDEIGHILGIRFYAGHPIRTSSGKLMGSFSAIDFETRTSSPDQLDSLGLLANLAAARIESLHLRAELDTLRKSFSTLAHEVRTPLNGILGATDILQREVTSHHQLETLDALRGSGQILLQLLNDSLESSRNGHPALQVHSRPFSLHHLLQLLIRNFQPLASTHQLLLSLTYDPTLPATVLGDQLRLSQILQNLIGNAIKFTPPGGVVHLSASRSPAADFLHLTIQDNGPGIDPQILDQVFEPYVQGPASQFRNSQGTGLGLGIAREIARALGGELTISSQPGQGTAAHVALPLHSLPNLAPGTRILVVDDDPVNQFVAQRLLELLNCQVESASNGAAALELLDSKPFDAILMDCLMPVMDGFEATRRIRARCDRPWQSIPIIALTGQSSDLDRQASLICGMNAVLVKPLELNALHHQLRLALQPDWLKGGTRDGRDSSSLAPSDEGDERRRL